ncbi:NADH-quinone oxidoreductase subunit L [Baia soyae]|uniref:NADH-quinone oxidoreductase subunit L n=2 Tax=Baia soyae TaxID=1544746 RepID=A0A4V2SXE1_9BACL|nr:NADH-quinone oxidoreductase subunit L [Baia soyae]
MMFTWAWVLPLFPLIAFVLLIALRDVIEKRLAVALSLIGIGVSFGFAVYLAWIGVFQQSVIQTAKYQWFSIGGKPLYLDFMLEPLNIVMVFLVSLVSLLVQIYSMGYMKDDARIITFYAYLSLFTSSMLGLVISANLLQIYFFWELVGLCSFLLVGFWYFKPEAKEAAKKAFIVTRIGDIGLLIAIFMIFQKVGSFDLRVIQDAVGSGVLTGGALTTVAILIFVGAVGKSGQFPLHTWLPDAMEGPTPVSALIHAATMVAAGVYLVGNLFFLFAGSEVALTTVAYIGGFTALFAATIAVTQNDIKRVLAYSTVSQLGFMMLGMGVGSVYASSFHLLTHGFFKALLFLAAGAVIVALHHEQDIRKMGGLWKHSKWLSIPFLIGCLSIAGIPPFSGFFSKDEILYAIQLSGKKDLLVIALLTTFFTAFYMFRLFYLVFAKKSREKHEVHSIPWSMKVSLAVLAVCSIVGGFFSFPTTNLSAETITHITKLPGHAPLWLNGSAVGASLLGILLATFLYVWRQGSAEGLAKRLSWLYQVSYRKYWIDELYQVVFVSSLKVVAWFLNGFDRFVVGGIVRFVGWGTMSIGRLGSMMQNGQNQTYVLVSLIAFLILFVSLVFGRLIG